MQPSEVAGLFWFRSDLRLRDNTALIDLVQSVDRLIPVFVLDEALLASPRMGAARVRFLLDGLERLTRDLEQRGSRLVIRQGDAEREILALAEETGARRLAWNRDVGPYATARDARVRRSAEERGVDVLERDDRSVFAPHEVRTAAGGPYSVYSPYARTWWRQLADDPRPPRRAPRLPPPPEKPVSDVAIPTAEALGFGGDTKELPGAGEAAARRRLQRFVDRVLPHYDERRDRPDHDGTSRLSPYLHFGMISVRDCVDAARAGFADPERDDAARRWVSQLAWRDFYHAVLAEHPRVLHEPWRTEFAQVRWEEDAEAFAAWCEGRTGYPIVDAGMRQLAATGWMHNRARMIVASFLSKDLFLDWRLGERFFEQHLVDADPANNDGGWQWCASTGTDAQPWFRIFNPTRQAERFDPDGDYVRRWVPELADLPGASAHRPWEAPALAPGYPAPIVDHAERREAALRRLEVVRRTR